MVAITDIGSATTSSRCSEGSLVPIGQLYEQPRLDDSTDQLASRAVAIACSARPPPSLPAIASSMATLGVITGIPSM